MRAAIRLRVAFVIAEMLPESLRQRLEELGGGPLPLPGGRTTPEAFDAFIRAEIAKWGEVVRRANVTLN